MTVVCSEYNGILLIQLSQEPENRMHYAKIMLTNKAGWQRKKMHKADKRVAHCHVDKI